MSPWDWVNGVRWRITTASIHMRSGTFWKAYKEVDLVNVRDVSYSESCAGLCQVGESGTISVFSMDYSNEPLLTISGIRDAKRVFYALRDALKTIHASKLHVEEF
mmetsp:Transcript_33949/g.85190  ORF Transcript_33949/g.85190 Transcript_33949/m.85190 type:complete len:105 (+) Transcript_33949:492-806(+)